MSSSSAKMMLNGPGRVTPTVTLTFIPPIHRPMNRYLAKANRSAQDQEIAYLDMFTLGWHDGETI